MTNIEEDIINGSIISFLGEDYIDECIAYSDHRPKLLANNEGQKVLNTIKEELKDCDEFYISVAFIMKNGLVTLLQELYELNRKGIKGRIITTDYFYNTEPEALKQLNQFDNIEVKLYHAENNKGFHTKGYIFKKGDVYKAIVGSSNITGAALTTNQEWNISFSSLDNGELLENLLQEFNKLWDSKNSNFVDDVFEEYKTIYDTIKRKEYDKSLRDAFINSKNNVSDDSETLEPNSMQKNFLDKINSFIDEGKDKAILISSTGTGKTYAAAFAVKDYAPERFLFLAHREQILNQAIGSFKEIFKGEDDKFGKLSGSSKDCEKDYLFATRQTMSNPRYYSHFEKDHFDYIIIDEAHGVATNSYDRILDYFEPKFLLGMTATPERRDGADIFEKFDYNIALEIRLQDALKEDLLCPFHYFGISDLVVDGEVIDDFTDFSYLISEERAKHLIEKSDLYNFSGKKRKALVFCRSLEEAESLTDEFNNQLSEDPNNPEFDKAKFLTGEGTSQREREEAIEKLADDDDPLEFIFTRDIFNEGVDIPEVNQVLLVRPTKSPIIFIQQLGRGLRKFENDEYVKEYVVIIDFIGNYENNFLIPMALSGDTSYDKDIARCYLMGKNNLIPGASSINFDEISKERIFKSMDDAKRLYDIRKFDKSYRELKAKLGRIPSLVDFYKHGDRDPIKILNSKHVDCYHDFLRRNEEEIGTLSYDEKKYLRFLTKELNGKRPHEFLILKLLIENNYFTLKEIEEKLVDYDIDNDFKSIIGSINVLTLNFFHSDFLEKYNGVSFINLNTDDLQNLISSDESELLISQKFEELLTNELFKSHIIDLADYYLMKYEDVYNQQTEGENLKLYEKYTRRDVCRLLNWGKENFSSIFGHTVQFDTGVLFVTYNKSEDIPSSIDYKDEFISRNIFTMMSTNKRTEDSDDVKDIINSRNNNINLHLFVKKSDMVDKQEFYYLGQVDILNHEDAVIDNKNTVKFDFKLHFPVERNFYNYLTTDIDFER